MRLSAIVAVSRNGVIGRDNDLPWRLPADLRRFKVLTTGHTMVMGRKTFESIGRVLPERRHVVLTRNPAWSFPGVEAAASLDEALELARDEREVFVIGGETLFREALPRCSRLYLTRVEADVEGDVRFPLEALEGWALLADELHAADDRNRFPLRFQIYERRGASSS